MKGIVVSAIKMIHEVTNKMMRRMVLIRSRRKPCMSSTMFVGPR